MRGSSPRITKESLPKKFRGEAPPRPGTTKRSERVLEQADDAGRALRMRGRALRHDLRRHLFLRQAWRQFLGLEVGGDQHERIVVRLHVGRRARAGVVTDALRALAADELRSILADLALGEAGHVGRN